ncbi:MAG: SafA/ExsA family spore coat assembly protein [Bacillota bacterium]
MTCFLACVIALYALSGGALADTRTYIVQPGDSLWKIAVKNQVGLSEIIAANPRIENPELIYPGQEISIPVDLETTAVEKEVVDMVNAERAYQGLPALSYNWELARVARYKSEDMRDKRYFSHQSPTYGSPFDMIRAFGISFRAAGENIAMGYKTPAEVMKGWMNSTGHRSNILNSAFTQIGVGYAKDSSGMTYWTQHFIRP